MGMMVHLVLMDVLVQEAHRETLAMQDHLEPM